MDQPSKHDIASEIIAWAYALAAVLAVIGLLSVLLTDAPK